MSSMISLFQFHARFQKIYKPCSFIKAFLIGHKNFPVWKQNTSRDRSRTMAKAAWNGGANSDHSALGFRVKEFIFFSLKTKVCAALVFVCRSFAWKPIQFFSWSLWILYKPWRLTIYLRQNARRILKFFRPNLVIKRFLEFGHRL